MVGIGNFLSLSIKFFIKNRVFVGRKTTHIQLLFYLEKDNLKVADKNNRPKLTTDFWAFHSRRQNQRKRSNGTDPLRPNAERTHCHSGECEQPTTLLNVSRNARDRHGSLVGYVLVLCVRSLSLN